MAGTTRHEEVDDPLGLAREVGKVWKATVAFQLIAHRGTNEAGIEKGVERGCTEAASGFEEKAAAIFDEGLVGRRVHDSEVALVAGQGFIEIQNGLGDHHPGGVLGRLNGLIAV